jgi:adenylylsulfate kinase
MILESVSSACTIWFTGLSGSGKTTASQLVRDMLSTRGERVECLDGDIVRKNLGQELGFSKEHRDTNVRRLGWLCQLLNRHAIHVCVASISPYEATRQEVAAAIGKFVLVHCTAPLEVLEARDVKGLYRRARTGELLHFTGVDDPYEPPFYPDVVITSDGREAPLDSASRVVEATERKGFLARLAEGGL